MEARREQRSGRATGTAVSADRDVQRRSGGSCTVSLRICRGGGDGFAEAVAVVLRDEKKGEEEEEEGEEWCRTCTSAVRRR